jgi:DNA-directed RNA polymerase subunit M/transcription elongation factor TFIIS
MSFRTSGKKALATVLTIETNINILEKNIFNQCSGIEKDYKKYIFQTIADVKSGKKISFILENIKQNKLGFNHPEFEPIKFAQKEQDDYITKPMEVTEGVVQCKCGSRRTISHSKQTRGGDEGMTVYSMCIVCKNKWSTHG